MVFFNLLEGNFPLTTVSRVTSEAKHKGNEQDYAFIHALKNHL